jgi:CubicO group peptidase (beta-lactamase class C family)
MKNLHFLLIWALGVALCVPLTAQELLPATDIGLTGVNPQRLARIEALCQSYVDNNELPGMVVLIASRGEIVLHEAYGMADVQAGKTMEKDAIFRIASQTKAITATAVMMLWEEGKFDLDDPISKYIPEFKDPQILETFNPADSSFTGRPAKREITIRHLLTHTSGLGYGMIDGDERFRKMYQKAGVMDLFTTEPITIGESVRRLARLPLHHEPGEKFTYSEGLDVLGYLVEILSGMPFDRFLQERLFEPLGMEDTYFYLPTSKADRLVAIQTKKDGKWVPYPDTFYDTDYPVTGARSFFSGGAGLSSTALDYARFLQMYLNGGQLNGTQILSPSTIRTIMDNSFDNIWDANSATHYGLAFQVTNQNAISIGGMGSEGTFSWGGYFNTQYFADPIEQVIGIIMKQTRGIPAEPSGNLFKRLVFSALSW